MSLLKSQLSSWTPEAWSRAGESLKTFAKDLEGSGDDYNSAILEAGGSWEGEGFDGAHQRGNDDIDDIDEVAERVRKAGDALASAGDSIKPKKDQIFFVVDDLIRTLYSVADDWTVTDIYPYSSPEERAALEPGRIAWAAKNTEELQAAARLVKAEDDEYGPKISAALNDLAGVVSPHAGEGVSAENASHSGDEDPLSAEQGQKDAEAILEGNATPEQIERFKDATNLSQEQLDALRNGEKIEIPRGQFDYLEQAIHAVNGKGELDAFEQFGDRYEGGQRDELKRGIADAINIVGNPSVSTPRPSRYPPDFIGPIPPEEAPKTGGINRLPESIKEPLLSPPGKVVGDDSALQYDQMPESAVHLPTLNQLDKLRGVMSHGKDSGIQGSDVNRLYLERTSEIAGIIHNHNGPFVVDQKETFDPSDISGNRTIVRDITLSKEEVTGKLDGFLDVASKDQVAFHDFLADGNPDAPSDVKPISAIPGDSFAPGSNWDLPLGKDLEMDTVDRNGSDRLKDLLALDWSEENGGDSGIRTLMSDMGNTDIVYQPGETPAPGATVLGENAQMVADHLGKEGENYLNMDGARDSLGVRNPGVVNAMSEGLGPHLIGLAGGERAEGGTWGTSGMDGQSEMSNMFAVLDTTEESATTINSWGANANQVLTSIYGATAEPGANGQFDDGGLGELSGRISNSMQDGLTLAANDLTHDERNDISNDYYKRSLQYDIARTATKEALGFVPGGKFIKPLADVASVGLKGEIIGPAEYLGDHTSEQQEILERAQKPVLESTQETSTDTLVSLINSSPDLDALAGEPIENTSLAPYLNEDGVVDIDKIDDERKFRAAANAALGELDDQWRDNANGAIDNSDWSGPTIRPEDSKPENPALDNN